MNRFVYVFCGQSDGIGQILAGKSDLADAGIVRGIDKERPKTDSFSLFHGADPVDNPERHPAYVVGRVLTFEEQSLLAARRAKDESRHEVISPPNGISIDRLDRWIFETLDRLKVVSDTDLRKALLDELAWQDGQPCRQDFVRDKLKAFLSKNGLTSSSAVPSNTWRSGRNDPAHVLAGVAVFKTSAPMATLALNAITAHPTSWPTQTLIGTADELEKRIDERTAWASKHFDRGGFQSMQTLSVLGIETSSNGTKVRLVGPTGGRAAITAIADALRGLGVPEQKTGVSLRRPTLEALLPSFVRTEQVEETIRTTLAPESIDLNWMEDGQRSHSLSLFYPFRVPDNARDQLSGLKPKKLTGREEALFATYFHPNAQILLGVGPDLTRPSMQVAVAQEDGLSGHEGGRCFYIHHPSYHETGEAWTIPLEDEVLLHRLTHRSVVLEVKARLPDGMNIAATLDATAALRLHSTTYAYQDRNADGERADIRRTFTCNGVKWRSDEVSTLPNALKTAFGLTGLEYIGDDRAFVFQSAVMRTSQPPADTQAAERCQVLLERMNMVDGFGLTRFYGEEASRTDVEASLFRRFAGLGSHIFCTDHSFGYLGFDGVQHGRAPGAKSFAMEYVQSEHMPLLYRKLVLYALLIRADIECFAMKFSEKRKAQAKYPVDATDIIQFREEFTLFRAEAWIPELSSQVQGRELFDLIRGRFGLDRRLDDLNARIARREAVIAAKQARDQVLRDRTAAQNSEALAYLFALFTVALTLLQVLGDQWVEDHFGLRAALSSLMTNGSFFWNVVVLTVIAILSGGVLVLLTKGLVGMAFWLRQILRNRMIR